MATSETRVVSLRVAVAMCAATMPTHFSARTRRPSSSSARHEPRRGAGGRKPPRRRGRGGRGGRGSWRRKPFLAPLKLCVLCASAVRLRKRGETWTRPPSGASLKCVGMVGGQWPTNFSDDYTLNVSAVVDTGQSQNRIGVPAAAHRGGYWSSGASAGVFAFALHQGPTRSDSSIGFRCVIPR